MTLDVLGVRLGVQAGFLNCSSSQSSLKEMQTLLNVPKTLIKTDSHMHMCVHAHTHTHTHMHTTKLSQEY